MANDSDFRMCFTMLTRYGESGLTRELLKSWPRVNCLTVAWRPIDVNPDKSHETAGGLHSGQQTQRHTLRRCDERPGCSCLEHRNDIVEGFTKQHGVHMLVYFELHDDMESAIVREKRLKKWNRAWKLRLIEEMNPDWNDLYGSIL